MSAKNTQWGRARAELDAEWAYLEQRAGFYSRDVAVRMRQAVAAERAIVDREQQTRISELEAKIAAQAREMQGISDYVGVSMTNQIRERWQLDQRKQQAAAIRWAEGKLWIEPDHAGKCHEMLELADAVERGDVKVENPR